MHDITSSQMHIKLVVKNVYAKGGKLNSLTNPAVKA